MRATIGSIDADSRERIVHQAAGQAGYHTLCGISLNDDQFKSFRPKAVARINCVHCHALWLAAMRLCDDDFAQVLK